MLMLRLRRRYVTGRPAAVGDGTKLWGMLRGAVGAGVDVAAFAYVRVLGG
ncbi:hypothetical protein Acsp02_15930 [Actinoplanes sp. NBRC 103695]|nr:hypothetical protein Acsp02_15930 [Actinoplanes sp. NBRC 103695]